MTGSTSATIDMSRLSFSQATAMLTPTNEVLRACSRNGIGAVSLWRHLYVAGDVARTRAMADDLGVVVSSLCRGGFFTGPSSEQEAYEDNIRALDEAVTVGAPVLVLVCGPVVDGDVASAEATIQRAIERLLPRASDARITLAIEPFHPMFIAERSAIVTLAQANRIVAELNDPWLGIAVDTYHVWWDPDLAHQLAAAQGRVAGVHVGDWLVPTSSLLEGRGLPGDGIVPLRGILDLLELGGYSSHLEVEVLNRELWLRDIDDVIRDVRLRMSALLGGPIAAAREHAVASPSSLPGLVQGHAECGNGSNGPRRRRTVGGC